MRCYSEDFFGAAFGDEYTEAMIRLEDSISEGLACGWIESYGAKRMVRSKLRLFKNQIEKTGYPKSLNGFKETVKADRIAQCFKLTEVEREALRLLALVEENRCVKDLYHDCLRNSYSLELFKGDSLGRFGHLVNVPRIEIEKAFGPRGGLVSNGLVKIDDNDECSVSSSLKKMLRSPNDCLDPRASILTKMDRVELTGKDFDFLGENYRFLSSLLQKALAKNAKGVNVLLYGEPGTGKTELAKTLCHGIGADLYSSSELSLVGSDEDPSDVRLEETVTAMALLAQDRNSVLIFDEAQDIFNEKSENEISKFFINRLLEDNATPVIWTSNGIDEIDQAHLRRFSFALELRTPPFKARLRVWNSELRKNGLDLPQSEIERIARDYELPPSFTSSSVRAAVLTGDSRAILKTITGLEAAVNGGSRPLASRGGKHEFSTDLLRADVDLVRLGSRLKNLKMKNFSMCLYGPPGTGKSEYATYLAEVLDMRVLKRKASDLKSKWLGETEANIAQAFREAAYGNYFLIFDEADSFLHNRKNAQRSWEVTEVNEMLSQMESHPLPFVCSTNLYETLDRASLRRFTFKVRFDYLDRARVVKAFKHFFGFGHDPGVNFLTPGDFALAARKARILGISRPEEISLLLSREVGHKGLSAKKKIGF
jgi:SpoVK/Ycf46/Vps4 family AAA+-type ATPase